jgi:hypothetical protein
MRKPDYQKKFNTSMKHLSNIIFLIYENANRERLGHNDYGSILEKGIKNADKFITKERKFIVE